MSVSVKSLRYFSSEDVISRSEFEKNLHLDKKDFGTIEFLLRKGNRQLEIYADSGVKNIVLVGESMDAAIFRRRL